MPPPRWGIARRLFAIDILTMAFVIALGGGTVARFAQIPDWPIVVLTCAAIAVIVPLLGWLRTHLDVAPMRVLHDWSFAFCVYAIYRMVLLVAVPGHSGQLFDAWYLSADRWLFGGDPAVWFAAVAHPVVTQVLEWAYAMFYLLPLAVAVEIYASGREWRFRQWAFVCGCGFFATYAGYLVMPAAGPRFAFAGGQTVVTLLSVAWAWRYRLRVRWVITVVGALLLVGTVYLRYHYVADVLGGVALAILCLALAPLVHGWLAGHLGTLDADRTA